MNIKRLGQVIIKKISNDVPRNKLRNVFKQSTGDKKKENGSPLKPQSKLSLGNGLKFVPDCLQKS